MSGRRAIFLLPLVLFAVLVAYFMRGLAPGYDPQLLPSALIDKPAPRFILPTFDGGNFSNAEFMGQVVLVNFFASWCVPCREEQPVLMELAKLDMVTLYGIDYKDKPDDADKFLKTLGNPYRSIGIDATGRTSIDFGVYGVPETYAIDRSGHIRWRHVGPMDEETVQKEVLPLLRRLGAS
jgi:cytochrome c biogenesis protein CcmG, thiol:disulfide interchange protein DsbE